MTEQELRERLNRMTGEIPAETHRAFLSAACPGKEATIVKKKISAGLVFALVLILVTVAAIAAGDCYNWDYMHPKRLLDTLRESGVLEDSYRYEALMAFLEVRSFADFERSVERHGSRWDDDIRLYKGYSYEDLGREMFDCLGYEIPDDLIDFFDFEAYGQYIASDLEECSDGFIQIDD